VECTQVGLYTPATERMSCVSIHVVDGNQRAARQQVVQEDAQVWLCVSAAEIISMQIPSNGLSRGSVTNVQTMTWEQQVQHWMLPAMTDCWMKVGHHKSAPQAYTVTQHSKTNGISNDCHQ